MHDPNRLESADFTRLNLAQLASDRDTWPELRPGVRQLVLREGPQPGERTSLLAYVPGAWVPKHRHTGDETIFILEGGQVDESGTYLAGTYMLNREGTEHSVRSPMGCLVLIHWRSPVVFVEMPTTDSSATDTPITDTPINPSAETP